MIKTYGESPSTNSRSTNEASFLIQISLVNFWGFGVLGKS